MTESEFDRRLMAILQNASPGTQGLDGFADLLGSIKNVVVSAGKKVAPLIGKIGTGAMGLVKAVGGTAGSVLKNLTGETGQTLLQVGSQVYMTKQAAKIEENKIALQTALVNQGYAAVSPEAQLLLGDVARDGITGSNGRVLYPGINQRSVAGFDLQTLTPYFLAAAGLVGLVIVTRSGARR